MSFVKKLRKWRLLLIVYLIALLPRLLFLGEAGIYSDEITWMVRGKEVVYSVLHRNLPYFHNAWWNKKNDTEAIGLPLVSVLDFHMFC